MDENLLSADLERDFDFLRTWDYPDGTESLHINELCLGVS